MFSPFLISINGCITIPAPCPPKFFNALTGTARPSSWAICSASTRIAAKREPRCSPINAGGRCSLPIGSQLEVVQTQVCRDQQEVLPTWEQRKTAMD